jgi:hypothetical protein
VRALHFHLLHSFPHTSLRSLCGAGETVLQAFDLFTEEYGASPSTHHNLILPDLVEGDDT